jgi:2-amino-4-hydroxy-6-hydroxymethyldihydropteridine diphosphokinase
VTEVFVGVGSNVEPEDNVRSALIALAGTFGVLRLSPVYRNRPIGFDGDDFLNMVVSFETDLGVDEIAAELGRIEEAGGRERSAEKFGPRTLDIDLLLFGSEVTRHGEHEIPRDEITRYAFVLKPLADLAGEKEHPGTGQTFEELWRAFDADSHPLEPVDLPLVR